MTLDVRDWRKELQSGDSACRDRASGELRSMLRRVLGRSFGSSFADDDLDELAQDAVVRIYEKLETFSGRSKFTTWAASIAVNITLSKLRRRKYQTVSLDDALELGEQSLVPSSEQTLHRRQRDQLVREAISTVLTRQQREALVAELGGLPLVEVARRLQKSRGAVYKILHDARRKLRAHFDEQGLGAADLLFGEA